MCKSRNDYLPLVVASSGWRSCAAYVVGHFVPTAAVLAKPARNRAKALFRSKAPAWLRSSGDDEKAAHLRQPLLSRHRPARGVFSFSPHQVRLPQAQALGGAGLASGRRPRNGATPGRLSKKAL